MTISVILTTYNGKSRGFLKEAIESVLNQTHKALELLIINDGSSDETVALCSPYLQDLRVRLISQSNQGLAAARNAGIRAARYPLIAFLDDDDLFAPTKLEKQHAFLEREGSDMVYTAICHIDTDSRVLKLMNHPAPSHIYEHLFKGNCITAPSSVLIKRSVLDRVGFFRESLLSSEDYDLWLRVAKHHSIHSLEEPLVSYRIHGNMMSSKLDRMEHYEKMVLSFALQEAPPAIQANRSHYFHLLHRRFAQRYSDNSDFANVRHHLQQSSRYEPLPLTWKARYWLSFCPPLYTSLRNAWLQI